LFSSFKSRSNFALSIFSQVFLSLWRLCQRPFTTICKKFINIFPLRDLFVGLCESSDSSPNANSNS
jgi:hypothetical protein